eukprot:13555566-Alexandrium_andersonii.AAC.1
MAATVAMFKLDGKLKLMRAAHARTRTQATVERGDWVWILRKNRLGVQWRVGPGVVVMVSGTS